MINRTDWFEDFQKNVSDLIAKSPAADIERNVKAMMAQTFSRLDLITREEFDTQTELLERALTRIAALEVKIRVLEGEGAINSGTSSAGAPDTGPAGGPPAAGSAAAESPSGTDPSR